ncbi:hypothetical protein [Stratiformator vulcanicus]|uniref:HEPN domain-containing protein n=1 Tax=Stratiformator vulcanicus TaxID=2527980 RepID=A0A517R693_9PLAN|nr:hypothetical protein [Stratiformator vulcanicus]QDT39417.1 hypothetical protein Pan189_38240 [Stratiformator vulcanicus]
MNPLAARSKNYDTSAAFEFAARARFLDGEILAADNRRAGAIMMYGYAVEMWLKVAILRVKSVPATTRFSKPKDLRKRLGVNNLHDIGQLAAELSSERKRQNAPLLPHDRAALTNHSARLQGLRVVEMRYKRIYVKTFEIHNARLAAAWFNENHAIL